MARSNKKTPKAPSKKKNTVTLTQSSKPAKPLFRLIPLTMAMATGLLGLKSVEIYQSGRALHEELFISTVIAQDMAQAEPEATAPATQETAPAAENATATTADTAAEGTDTPSGDTAQARPADYFEGRNQGSYNQREVDVLGSLSERREAIDKLERDLALRERVLQATEERIDGKIAELSAMSAELKELLVTYDEEEDAKISSLVKIYEAMKPKDAARIFDELDMDILLLVVDRMSERRVAPVLAAMSPQKAKDLTQQLADKQKARPQADGMLDDSIASPPLF